MNPYNIKKRRDFLITVFNLEIQRRPRGLGKTEFFMLVVQQTKHSLCFFWTWFLPVWKGRWCIQRRYNFRLFALSFCGRGFNSLGRHSKCVCFPETIVNMIEIVRLQWKEQYHCNTYQNSCSSGVRIEDFSPQEHRELAAAFAPHYQYVVTKKNG